MYLAEKWLEKVAICIEKWVEKVRMVGERMNLAEEMKKRNMTEEHLMEYMIFEDECISKGFTFKDILKVLNDRRADDGKSD